MKSLLWQLVFLGQLNRPLAFMLPVQHIKLLLAMSQLGDEPKQPPCEGEERAVQEATNVHTRICEAIVERTGALTCSLRRRRTARMTGILELGYPGTDL